MEKHPIHLKNPEFQTSPEVQDAVEKQERLTGERVPNDPAERIEAYAARLEKVFLNPDRRVRERNLEMLRPKIHDALLIKRENFPESYFDLQKRIARERGQQVDEIPPDIREQMMDTAIQDQRHSLDAWIDYLSSDDAVYPAWFKHYAWTQVIRLSQFDKERGEYKRRTASTVAPFPDIYREPLAQIADAYEKVRADNASLKDPEIRELFSRKFPALYAELTARSLAASIENREETRGQWVRYEQGDGDAAERLFQSLDGKGTGWCTAGRSTAQAQVDSGDFHVYYTDDASGQPAQPRLAIRMDGRDRIGEVRGVLPHQEVEPVMQEILDRKLAEFGPEADAYRKKSADMRHLTALERKREKGEPFSKDDLLFLYEIDSPIEGFGYGRDPRIEELRQGRDTQADMLTVFECTREQVARSVQDIRADTRAYVGPLEPSLFQKLPDSVEHIYTAFPEKRIRRDRVEVGGRSAEDLLEAMRAAGIRLSDYAESMMRNRDGFTVSPEREQVDLARLSVADLGFPSGANTEQVFARAQELGLELCPPDTGPNYRMQYKDQSVGDYLFIGMKPIAASGGSPFVFRLGRDAGGLWLSYYWAKPDDHWFPDRGFVFLFRKSGT